MSTPLSPSRYAQLRALLALLLALGALAILPPRARATGFTFNVVKGDDSGTGSLRQAIANAGNGDTIVFHPTLLGTPPTVTLTGGELLVNKNLTIQGTGIGGVAVRRGSGTGRIFRVAAGSTVILDGLAISGGRIDRSKGGAIFNQGTLALTNSTVRDNLVTDSDGGGVANEGTMTLTNSTVIANAADVLGGGIANTGTLTITTSTFSANNANTGGGIANSGTLTVTSSIIDGNTGSNIGGGLVNASGTLTIASSLLNNNVAGFAGGGLYNHRGTASVTNSTVSSNNSAPSSGGGGGLNNTEGTLTVTGSTITGNNGSVGGGAYNYLGSLTLRNSTVSGNHANDSGGGLYNYQATATLSFATLTQNSAPSGAGIYNEGDATIPASTTLGRSIVAGNGSQDCLFTNAVFAPMLSAGFNVLGTAIGCPAGGSGDATHSGALGTLLNATLAANGGPTKTHALPPGSPALERVPTAQCAVATDQRGTARPQGTACDSGAFELVVRILTLGSTGGGTIARAPSGDGAGPFVYTPGTAATLTPLPNNGQTFIGWLVDGVAKGWPGPLTITMNADHTVQADFAPTKGFSDVPTGRADLLAITELASRGTIRGYQDGRYGPDEGVQRAQMAALIARAMPAGPGTPPTNLAPPACTTAGTWDCEVWPNTFLDQGGLDDGLWRDVAALGQHGVANGYAQADCAARGKAFPCFGPTDPVTYAETITFITRAMQEKGYWVAQPGAPLPAGVPTVFATPVRTFAFYAGGIPDPPTDWNAGATRGWFAQALWAALDSYWRTDGNLPDGRPGGGLVP